MGAPKTSAPRTRGSGRRDWCVAVELGQSCDGSTARLPKGPGALTDGNVRSGRLAGTARRTRRPRALHVGGRLDLQGQRLFGQRAMRVGSQIRVQQARRALRIMVAAQRANGANQCRRILAPGRDPRRDAQNGPVRSFSARHGLDGDRHLRRDGGRRRRHRARIGRRGGRRGSWGDDGDRLSRQPMPLACHPAMTDRRGGRRGTGHHQDRGRDRGAQQDGAAHPTGSSLRSCQDRRQDRCWRASLGATRSTVAIAATRSASAVPIGGFVSDNLSDDLSIRDARSFSRRLSQVTSFARGGCGPGPCSRVTAGTRQSPRPYSRLPRTT